MMYKRPMINVIFIVKIIFCIHYYNYYDTNKYMFVISTDTCRQKHQQHIFYLSSRCRNNLCNQYKQESLPILAFVQSSLQQQQQQRQLQHLQGGILPVVKRHCHENNNEFKQVMKGRTVTTPLRKSNFLLQSKIETDNISTTSTDETLSYSNNNFQYVMKLKSSTTVVCCCVLIILSTLQLQQQQQQQQLSVLFSTSTSTSTTKSLKANVSPANQLPFTKNTIVLASNNKYNNNNNENNNNIDDDLFNTAFSNRINEIASLSSSSTTATTRTSFGMNQNNEQQQKQQEQKSSSSSLLQQQQQQENSLSDIEQTLNQMKVKKQVNPTTHG